MNDREAQQLVRSIEEHWRTDFGDDGRRIWRDAMRYHDSVTASVAVQKLSETESYPPRVVDVREMIKKLEADERVNTPALPEPPPGPVPEWVLVWRWARYERDPQVNTAFPQQHPFHQPPYLTDDEYRELHAEWLKEGAPGRKLRPEQIVGA